MAATAEYGNLNFISIPSTFPSGTANPYPSQITVAGVPGNITSVTVTLRDIEHGTPSTVEVLLAGPDNSTNVVLMADVGNDTVTDEIYIEFDDAAASSLPCFGSGPLPSGLPPAPRKPTNCGVAVDFPAPAPPRGAGYGSTMSVFNGQSPNGTWRLYVRDPIPGGNGLIRLGWLISITTDAPTAARVVATGGSRYDGGLVELNWHTSDEVDNLGFRLYRESDGEPHLITPGLVAGSALQGGARASAPT